MSPTSHDLLPPLASGLGELGRTLSRSTPQAVLCHLLEQLTAALGACSGSISVVNEQGTALVLLAGSGNAEHFVGQSIPIGDGILGWVAQHRRPLVLNGDVSGDPRFRNLPARELAAPVSALCQPLIVGERLVGVLSLNRDPHQPPFTEDDLARSYFLVSIAAMVVDNLLLRQSRERQIAELRDINAKLQAQREALERERDRRLESEQRLASILDLAPEAIIVLDDSLRIVLFNRGAEQIFGYPAHELLGRTLDPLLPEGSAEAHARHIRDFAAGQPDRRLMGERGRSILGRRRNGEVFPCEAGISKCTHAGKQYFMAILRDVSEQRRLEARQQELTAKLQAMQDQLFQSEKMAAIGTLAAGVAHEINNPIGFVGSNLGQLEKYHEQLLAVIGAYEAEEPRLPAEARDRIHAVKRQADLEFLRQDLHDLVRESREGVERVRKIVQDLKSFSRVDAPVWEWADLHRCIESTLNIVRNEIKYKAEVIKDYGELPPVECIASQISQVIMNLLVNAAQAIEQHGTITIRTRHEGDSVCLAIADTGCGIPPENLKRIFEPFFTTKPVGKGTGLGLSIAYNIVSQHHGRIEVESEPGRGTTFRVWLPVRQDEPKADRPAANESTALR